jgi:hypothetical protein
MKLVSYGEKGNEKPGIIGKDGKLHTLHRVIRHWEIDVLNPGAFRMLSSVDASICIHEDTT